MCPYVHSGTITIAKTWKQPVCPLMNEWTETWSIYMMEHCSVIKIKILPFATTKMDEEGITHCETSEQRQTLYVFSNIRNFKK